MPVDAGIVPIDALPHLPRLVWPSSQVFRCFLVWMKCQEKGLNYPILQYRSSGTVSGEEDSVIEHDRAIQCRRKEYIRQQRTSPDRKSVRREP